MPEISVIMSTYNEKLEYLTEAIESVRAQTFQDYEFIIILDNPQNEEIRECVFQYAKQDSRIRVIQNEVNLGLTKSLNKAIQVAKGIYMSRMDADDIMVADCLARELEEIRSCGLDFVSASKINMDEQGNKLGTYINDFYPKQMKYLLPYDNSINHPTVMVRFDLIRKENGYREIPSCEDYDLWLRLLFHGCRMRILPDVFLKRRMRSEGICESNSYQLYLSKRFLLEMCKRSRKNPGIWNQEKAYSEFISGKNLSDKKAEQFNHAYELLYKGIEEIKRGNCYKGFCIAFRAIFLEGEIAWVIWNKISYQIRKRLILKCIPYG